MASNVFTVDSDRIKITGTLEPAPPDASGRWRLALIARDDSLDGADTKIYLSSSSMQEDVDAGFLSQAIQTAGSQAFANGAPDVAVIKWDETGGDSLTDALDAACTAGLQWYWTALVGTTGGETVTIDGWLSDKRKQQIELVNTVANWITGGATVPSPIDTISTSLRTSVVVYDKADDYPNAAAMGKYSSINPDRQALGAVVSIQAVQAQGLTDTEWAEVKQKNGNVAELNRSLSPNAVTFYPGKLLSGEVIEAVHTLHWTEYAIEDAMSALFARYDAAGLRPPRVPAPWIGAVAGVGELGLAAGHFRITPDLPDGFSASAVYNGSSGCMDVTVSYGYNDGVRCACVNFALNREG